MACVSKCNGGCCASFYLRRGFLADIRAAKERDLTRDQVFIRDMVIHLTPTQRNERLASLGYPKPYDGGPDMPGLGLDGEVDFYTCRHFNTTTRMCMAYEDRPAMCSDFPYGQACFSCKGHSDAQDTDR